MTLLSHLLLVLVVVLVRTRLKLNVQPHKNRSDNKFKGVDFESIAYPDAVFDLHISVAVLQLLLSCF